MIARLTRILLLLQIGVALGIAAGAMKTYRLTPATALLAGVAVVLLVRLVITANNFSLAWRHRSVTPPEHRIGPGAACALFFGEFRATMTASSWLMPFCTFDVRRASHEVTQATLPALLIHGYGCNSGYWNPLSFALADAGITHYAIDMEPMLCGIDDYVPRIRRVIERICRETGCEQIIIVAHSMGGLATRAYFRACDTERVAVAITLGTPHHGTALAHYGIGTNTQQMRWTLAEEEGLESEWIRALVKSESESVRAKIVSIFSHHDNIIAPQTSSVLAGAVNIPYHGIGHVALAFHPEIQQRVIEEIRKASSTRMPLQIIS